MASSPSRIAALASIITTNTAKIDEYLSSHNLAPLSFNPAKSLPKAEEFVAFQRATLEAVTKLESLVLGPLGIIQKASAVSLCNCQTFTDADLRLSTIA